MTEAWLRVQGPWEVRREIKIPSISQPEDIKTVKEALSQVPGVRAVAVDPSKHRLEVRYEITQTDYQSIERVLEAVGFPPAGGWWARRRSKWFQSMDVTGRANAVARPSACCNKPPTSSGQ